MTISELIAKLSEFDGNMQVVFRTSEQMSIDEYETYTQYRSHDVEICASDQVESAPWETRKCDPFVVIELDEGR